MNKIYILHGWAYNLDKWKRFETELKKTGLNPIFLKIPGLTQKTDQVWDIGKYSDWLLDQLRFEKKGVILLGHSNGGRIAAYFSSQHPERVKKLILIDSAGIYHKELLLQLKRFFFKSIATIGRKLTKSPAFEKFLYFLARGKDYFNAKPTMRKTMINLIKHDLTPFLSKISAPTLIIWGREDKITPLNDGLLIHKLIKNSKLKVINGARHSPFYTHPKEVAETVKNGI